LAVQLPQNDFIDLVVSSKIVVLCDMQTTEPQSTHLATACPLQTEHLANHLPPIFPPTSAGRATQNSCKIFGAWNRA
jgi:hypothetical protein